MPTKVYAPTEFFVPFLTIVITKEAIHVYNLSIFHVKNSGKYLMTKSLLFVFGFLFYAAQLPSETGGRA